jgi:hypothetical protein
LRPWRSQRKLYVVIYRGALRRRMRRLVRSRVFNNARTATRNRDLPLAMEGPHLTHKPVYRIGGFQPVYGGNTAVLFLASAGYAGGFFLQVFSCGPGCGPKQKYHPSLLKIPAKSLIFLVPQEGFEPPTPSLRITRLTR